jgi:hypothetical protein
MGPSHRLDLLENVINAQSLLVTDGIGLKICYFPGLFEKSLTFLSHPLETLTNPLSLWKRTKNTSRLLIHTFRSPKSSLRSQTNQDLFFTMSLFFYWLNVLLFPVSIVSGKVQVL